ncbi:hypothetical protein MPTK1_6g16070 [Marchantia polymorpha subsp. ruderalis]|uniref:Uncharacterized protein n=2 Tax=Marchantia polymorpha TaxID=3197 RepID=A0AAF6BSK6_MARPO|nr:hypothetical protein MARPO_0056s0119 [Marchantia polymorpha]BBN14990.1 hypothetical protein Mp_6g16070 [Marchantia polymorpha subsp. ruderalis]|eukprot:PTQ37674.1 hypothetical protein MARPO_0056s0119 [Marchantia polymorpha]
MAAVYCRSCCPMSRNRGRDKENRIAFRERAHFTCARQEDRSPPTAPTFDGGRGFSASEPTATKVNAGEDHRRFSRRVVCRYNAPTVQPVLAREAELLLLTVPILLSVAVAAAEEESAVHRKLQ